MPDCDAISFSISCFVASSGKLTVGVVAAMADVDATTGACGLAGNIVGLLKAS